MTFSQLKALLEDLQELLAKLDDEIRRGGGTSAAARYASRLSEFRGLLVEAALDRPTLPANALEREITHVESAIGGQDDSVLHSHVRRAYTESRALAAWLVRQEPSAEVGFATDSRDRTQIASASKAPLGYDSAKPVQFENATTVAVWFGTNRFFVEGGPPATRFANKRSNLLEPLQYGMAVVSIPHIHREAKIERPSLWKLEFSENPNKHMMVRQVEVLDVASWCEKGRLDDGDGLIFIHGFNVSFEEALLRTAQIAFDLKFSGLPFCFSWASAAATGAYAADEGTAEWSVPHLQAFLATARTKLGLKRVHIIAHSMGSRILMRALERSQLEPQTAERAPISQIVLAAADIDVDVFKQLKSVFVIGEQVTAYASRADRALQLSKGIHKAPRLGGGDPPLVMDGLATVDATAAGADMFGIGHGYVASNRSVFGDLYYLIRLGLKPNDRKSIRRHSDGYYELV